MCMVGCAFGNQSLENCFSASAATQVSASLRCKVIAIHLPSNGNRLIGEYASTIDRGITNPTDSLEHGTTGRIGRS